MLPGMEANLRKTNRLWCLCLQSGTLPRTAYYSFDSAEASQQTGARLVKQQRSIFPKATCRPSDQHDNLLL